MMAKLKPCPFCGYLGILIFQDFRSTVLGEHRQFAVRCGYSECGVNPQTRWCLTKREACGYWNDQYARQP